jgi:hypothetical protein
MQRCRIGIRAYAAWEAKPVISPSRAPEALFARSEALILASACRGYRHTGYGKNNKRRVRCRGQR